MARTLKQSKTIIGSTSSSSWTWKQVINEYFEEDSSNSNYYITSNKSIIVAQSYIGVANGKPSASFGGSAATNIKCESDNRSKSQSWIYQSFWINPGAWKLIQEEEFTVEHNSDGKKTISVSSGLSTTSFNPNSASASGSVELTTIPRASDIAVSNTDLGQNIPITIGKKVDTFTSTLTYTIGTLTGTIVEKTSLSNYPWVMSTTLINQIKNAYPNTGSYAKGGVETKITCKTYNGTTLIGSKDATFKLYITDKPVISSATRTELNTKISALTTNVLRHVSQNKFTITASAPTGASITGYRVKNGTQDSGLSTSNVVNLNDIQSYYEESNVLKTKFIVTCVDSRGNESEEFPVVCNFTNYIQVSINKTDVTIKRSSGTSTDCKIYATGNFFNGKIGTTDNTIAFKVRSKLKTATTWGNWITVSTTYTGNTFKVNNVTIAGIFSYTENYDFELMATDKIGETDDYSKVFVNSVPTEKHHSKGAWIRELSFEKADIFPVGFICISAVNENPSKYFVGTWKSIGEGKTLIGVDPSDTDFNTSEKTGGSKKHSHTYGVQYNGYWGSLIGTDEEQVRLYDGKTQQFIESTYTETSSYQDGNSSLTNSKKTIQSSVYETKTNTTEESTLPPYITVYFWKRIS